MQSHGAAEYLVSFGQTVQQPAIMSVDDTGVVPDEGDASVTGRYCYYLTPTMLTADGYLPIIVIEGVPGSTPPSGDAATAQPSWWGDDLAVAKLRVEEANARLGITPQDARNIVLSSMSVAFECSGPRPANPTA